MYKGLQQRGSIARLYLDNVVIVIFAVISLHFQTFTQDPLV